MENEIINPAYLNLNKRLKIMSKDLKLKSEKLEKKKKEIEELKKIENDIQKEVEEIENDIQKEVEEIENITKELKQIKSFLKFIKKRKITVSLEEEEITEDQLLIIENKKKEIINPSYLIFKKRLEVMSKNLKLKSKKFSKETNTQLGSELESELEYIKLIINNLYNHNNKKELLELIRPELLILESKIISTRDMLLKICNDENVEIFMLICDNDDENVEILKLKAYYLIGVIRQILDIIKYF